MKFAERTVAEKWYPPALFLLSLQLSTFLTLYIFVLVRRAFKNYLFIQEVRDRLLPARVVFTIFYFECEPHFRGPASAVSVTVT